ncbi:MAG: sulfatase family protein, partial [Blastocatellia bacterium]
KVPVERIGYLTDLLTERAVAHISRRKQSRRPFFLSLNYTAPHWPWEGPEDAQVSRTLKEFSAGGSLKVYASMMKSLDDGIGKVLKALGEARLERNTLVIFTSDNGGERFSYHWPFSGQKWDLLEGGIRVPAMVRWPGTVPANRSTEQVAITMDWTATILKAAQSEAAASHPLDGDDLLPVCQGRRAPFERTLFWRQRSNWDAVRRGQWKYLRNGEKEYLFDLSVDEREQADFKESNPEMFRQLKSEFQRWDAQVLPRRK